MARGAPRRRRLVPRPRRLDRRARPGGGTAHPCRGAHRGPPLRRGRRAVRRRASGRGRDRLRRARGAGAVRRGPGRRRSAVRRARRSSFCPWLAISRRGRSSPMSTGPTCSSAWASAGTSCRASPRRSPSSTRRTASPSARASRATFCKADILGWRSRCRRRQRDLQAAQEDVERGLELAHAMDDRRVIAATRISRLPSSPSEPGTGCCRATTRNRRRRSIRSSTTSGTWAA